MAVHSARENLGAFDAEIYAIVLHRRNRSLRNTGKSRELALTQPLQFTQDAQRFSDGDFNALLRTVRPGRGDPGCPIAIGAGLAWGWKTHKAKKKRVEDFC